MKVQTVDVITSSSIDLNLLRPKTFFNKYAQSSSGRLNGNAFVLLHYTLEQNTFSYLVTLSLFAYQYAELGFRIFFINDWLPFKNDVGESYCAMNTESLVFEYGNCGVVCSDTKLRVVSPFIGQLLSHTGHLFNQTFPLILTKESSVIVFDDAIRTEFLEDIVREQLLLQGYESAMITLPFSFFSSGVVAALNKIPTILCDCRSIVMNDMSCSSSFLRK